MTLDPTTNAIDTELSRLHEIARRCYIAKDIPGYMAAFSKNLSYRQANGRVIDYETLYQDVAAQLRSVTAAQWSYSREAFSLDQGNATETLLQTGYVATTAFGFVHRIWLLRRRGRYTYVWEDSSWKIGAVEVLDESLSSSGMQFGLNAKLPSQPASAA